MEEKEKREEGWRNEGVWGGGTRVGGWEVAGGTDGWRGEHKVGSRCTNEGAGGPTSPPLWRKRRKKGDKKNIRPD